MPSFNVLVARVEAIVIIKFQSLIPLLKDKDKYCCLGVLAKVCDITYNSDKFTFVGYEENEILPNDFIPTLNKEGFFPNKISVLRDNTSYSSLIEMNDSGFFTFEDIANIIEHIWE